DGDTRNRVSPFFFILGLAVDIDTAEHADDDRRLADGVGDGEPDGRLRQQQGDIAYCPDESTYAVLACCFVEGQGAEEDQRDGDGAYDLTHRLRQEAVPAVDVKIVEDGDIASEAEARDHVDADAFSPLRVFFPGGCGCSPYACTRGACF